MSTDALDRELTALQSAYDLVNLGKDRRAQDMAKLVIDPAVNVRGFLMLAQFLKERI